MRNTSIKEDLLITLSNLGTSITALLLTVLATLLRGVTIALCNNWVFAVIYKLPQLSYVQGYAISLIIVIVKGYKLKDKDKPKDKDAWYKDPLTAMMFNGFGIFMLWIVTMFL